MGLEGFEQQLILDDEEEKAKVTTYAHAFFALRGRRGHGKNNRGCNFSSIDRGSVQPR